MQEALTNTLTHAGPARAEVRVRYRPARSSSRSPTTAAGDGAARRAGGHGLVGMRERVAFYGGRLEAGTRPAGG